MKKLFGLLSGTLLVGLMSVGLVNNVKVDDKTVAAPVKETLEVKDVLKMDALDGSGRTVKKAAAPAANYTMSDARIQVSTPDATGNVDVRFVAAIDSFSYSNAQFIIEMYDDTNTSKGKITREVTTAYTGIMLGDVVYSAADIFGEGHEYFIAYTLLDMPRDVWSYGFKVTTGLKQEADTDYTTKLTDEVKVVKSAILADNHLVFNWLPYNGNYATLTWENNFVAGAVSDLDPSVENYGDLVTEIVKTNVSVEITTKDGTIYTNNPANTHCSGSANVTHAVNVAFSGFNTENEEYTVKATVVLADGTVVTGVKNFDRLGNVSNVVVTESDGKYVLTFDALANAEEYTYKIFNDTYTGDTIAVKSGDTLATAALEVGTYSLEITAEGSGYATSTTVIENAFVVEKTLEISDATDYYDIEFVHSGQAWEGKVNFKALSSEYAVSGTQKVSNFEVYAGESKVSAAAINAWGGAPGAYDYDLDDGYHSFSFSINGWYQANTTYTIKFLVEADSGIVYSVEFSYVVGEVAEGAFPIDMNSFTKEHFVLLLNDKYNSLDENSYDEAVWTLITNLYNEQLAVINDDASTNDERKAAVTAFESGISNYVEQQLIFTSAEASSGNASQAIDGNTGSRWESAHQNDGQYIIFYLDAEYSISKLSIMWENANAESYDVYTSTDGGTTWTLAKSMTGCAGGNRTDSIVFDDFVDANAIKIECINRNLTYGYSIYEFEAWGYSK